MGRYDAEAKGERAKVREAIMKALVEITDNQFAVAFESDDGGTHVCVRIERNPDDTIGYTERIEGKIMGWRVIHMNVPDGYLRVFYNDDGTKRITKE